MEALELILSILWLSLMTGLLTLFVMNVETFNKRWWAKFTNKFFGIEWAYLVQFDEEQLLRMVRKTRGGAMYTYVYWLLSPRRPIFLRTSGAVSTHRSQSYITSWYPATKTLSEKIRIDQKYTKSYVDGIHRQIRLRAVRSYYGSTRLFVLNQLKFENRREFIFKNTVYDSRIIRKHHFNPINTTYDKKTPL